MSIKIQNGNTTIESLGRTRDFETVPDDRITLVQTVTNTGASNVVVEDYGVVAKGEKISLNAIFSNADYETLKTLWSARTLCTVTLDDGRVINNARVLIRRTKYSDVADADLTKALQRKLSGYKNVTLEVWLV